MNDDGGACCVHQVGKELAGEDSNLWLLVLLYCGMVPSVSDGALWCAEGQCEVGVTALVACSTALLQCGVGWEALLQCGAGGSVSLVIAE